jgi:hypothetical protein
MFLAWFGVLVLVGYGVLFVGLSERLKEFAFREDAAASDEAESRDARRIGVGLLVGGASLSAFLALI